MLLKQLSIVFSLIAMFLFTHSIKAESGKQLYTNNCIRCHNANPAKPGSIGPELRTTPEYVFQGKITKGIYPFDYKPKRRTKIMPKFKFNNEQIDLIIKHIKETK